MVLTSSPNFSGLRHQNLPILGLKSPEFFIQGIKVSFSNKKLDLKNSFLLEPVKLCHQVFVATQDCVYDLNDQDLNEERFDLMEKSSFALINARFLGHEVNEDESILKVINDR
jgi:predicted GNAT family N-acyltransferase